MAHSVLFVGGPHDGVMREVEELLPVYLAEQMIAKGEIPRYSFVHSNQIEIRVRYYTLIALNGEKDKHYLYVAEGITASTAILMLMRNYRVTKHG